MTEKDNPICVKCVHYYYEERTFWFNRHVCLAPPHTIDLVTGKAYSNEMLCSQARESPFCCGKAGKWFEPK